MAMVNPFKLRTCPFCSHNFYPGNCPIVSTRNVGAVTTGQVLRPAQTSFLARMFVEPVEGFSYVQQDARRQCPKCGGYLPRNVERADSYTIAIVGDVRSGKSHYIASCLNALQQSQIWQVIGCTMIVGQGNTDGEYDRTYYDPVFRKKQMILNTQPAVSEIAQPLVYEVVFSKKSLLQPAKTINLLFYDSSGEDYVQFERLPVYSHYVLNAAAIIFLADPLEIPGIVSELPSHLQSNSGPGRLSPHQALGRVIQTFKQANRISAGATIKTPIAITLSKSDLLEYITQSGKPLFLSDDAYGNNLDTQPFEIINEEVQMLLKRTRGDQLISMCEQFENQSFFAVSPTGWEADSHGKFPRIEPKRCLDPVLWSLWKLNIINNV